MPRASDGMNGATPSGTMTVEEVATYLRIHPSTVYRLARGGTIPGGKVGSQWRFQKARVDEWLAANRGAFAEG